MAVENKNNNELGKALTAPVDVTTNKVPPIEPVKKTERGAWRSWITHTCTAIGGLFVVLAVPIYLIGQSHRHGFLKYFFAPSSEFPFDVRQTSLQSTKAVTDFIEALVTNFERLGLFSFFQGPLIIYAISLIIYGVVNRFQKPSIAPKVIEEKSNSEKKRFFNFALIMIPLSASLQILVIVSTLVWVSMLQLLDIFEDLGYVRARRFTSEVTGQFSGISEVKKRMNTIGLVGDARPAVLLECGPDLCIVIIYNAATEKGITKIVPRQTVQFLEREHSLADLRLEKPIAQ